MKSRLQSVGVGFVAVLFGFAGLSAMAQTTFFIQQKYLATSTSGDSVRAMGGITAGTGNVAIVGTDGRLPALTSTYLASLSGAALTALNAAQLTGTVPLASLVGITNAQIDAAAAIGWTKISKTGSSLADLATRSASDLNSGAVPNAQISASSVNQHQATLSIGWAQVSKTGSSLADLATKSAADLSTGSLLDARVQQSNVTQHQAALTIGTTQLSGNMPDGRIPSSNVTQHQASLSIAGSQLTGSVAQARLSNVLGAWTTPAIDTVILAATDLVVILMPDASSNFQLLSDGGNPPSTQRAYAKGTNETTATGVVRKGDYYKVVGSGGATGTIYAIAIGG